MKQLVAVLAFLIPFSVLAAEVYKWTDAQGHVHFGDKPTQQDAKKVTIKAGSGDGGTEAARQASAVEKLKMQDKRYADCKDRREKLTTWKAASKIVEQDALGKERTYTDAEKQELVKRTQASIDKDCEGA